MQKDIVDGFIWYWVVRLGLVVLCVFALGYCAASHAGGLVNQGVHCADGILCKDENIEIEGVSYICKDPLIAIEIATYHKAEGFAKAKSAWDLHVDRGDCILYPDLGGIVGDLVLDAGVVKVVSFQVEWPAKKVWLLTKMDWKRVTI